MSYKIQYTPQDNRRYPQKSKRSKRQWGVGALFLSIMAVLIWISVQGVPDFLILPEIELAKNAAQSMIEDVREGESVEHAVLVFCKQVINGEKS